MDNSFEKLNIIILYAEDMAYGDLAIQNEESKIPTPNLDHLQERACALPMDTAHQGFVHQAPAIVIVIIVIVPTHIKWLFGCDFPPWCM